MAYEEIVLTHSTSLTDLTKQTNLTSMLPEIQKTLKDNVDAEYRDFLIRLVPTSKKVFGVRVTVINELAKEYKNGGIPLVEALWKSGAYEERLLAAKILAKHAKKNPDKTLQLVHDYSTDLIDWAICDTLGMQTVKPIIVSHKKEIFQLSDELIRSKNLWQRRLALVMLEYYTRFPDMHPKIRKQISIVKNDAEHYVKKAVKWLERDLGK
jgi:3-methyladenine DNA glycosylase AlkD